MFLGVTLERGQSGVSFNDIDFNVYERTYIFYTRGDASVTDLDLKIEVNGRVYHDADLLDGKILGYRPQSYFEKATMYVEKQSFEPSFIAVIAAGTEISSYL